MNKSLAFIWHGILTRQKSNLQICSNRNGCEEELSQQLLTQKIVIRFSFGRKNLFASFRLTFLHNPYKSWFNTLRRLLYTISVFSRDFLVLLLMIAACAAVIAAAYFIPIFIIFLYVGTVLPFHLLLIYLITFCCVAEFLAPLLIDSLISLKYAFGVSGNVNFSIHYFFSLKCCQLFCPRRLHLVFPTG